MTWKARIRKIILWSAASLSTLLAVIWIASMWWSLWVPAPGKHLVLVQHGRLAGVVSHFEGESDPLPPPALTRTEWSAFWWFDWQSRGGKPYIAIPLWAPLLLTAGITAYAWRKEVVARRRANQHKCPACRYEMAGLAAGAACPECGKTKPGE